MAAHGMTLMDPAGEPGTAVDFGLSRLFAIGLYLGKPLLPTAHLEPIVRETDLTARVTFGLSSIGFDCFQQVIGRNACVHSNCNLAQAGPSVSDPVLRIGG